LEAMASKALIIAHKNDFNQAILQENAYYFSSSEDINTLISKIKKRDNLQFLENNFKAIKNQYNWNTINGDYLQLFQKSLS
jgi:glycosyltransferase involved in cell wall biosynthesis